MKTFLLSLLISLQICSLHLFAQTNLQIGASGVFSKTKGNGLEIMANLKVAKGLSLGLGTQPIKFEEHNHWYVPVFSSLKYYYSLNKTMLFANVDPGYGIYPAEDLSGGTVSFFYRKGTIYLSGGVGIAGKSKLAPYASIHFTKFGFRQYLNGMGLYRPISTFTFSAGIMLNNSVPDKIVFHKRIKLPPPAPEPVVVLTANDYLKLSIRQRKTGRIFLITGGALIAAGLTTLALQEHKGDDRMEIVLPIVFMGFPGIASSLISITLFASSRHNENKAIKMGASVF